LFTIFRTRFTTVGTARATVSLKGAPPAELQCQLRSYEGLPRCFKEMQFERAIALARQGSTGLLQG